MKKILIRAGMSVFNEYETAEILAKNLIGNNIGNLIFSYSMMRTLMTEDTLIDTIMTTQEKTDEEIDFINSEYDCFVLPLANAFRVSFMKELKIITNLVKKLTIPCIVVGVGIQAGVDENIEKEFEFDQVAKEFVDAVLEKSNKIGVRGEITGRYLTKLGFKKEEDFTVIGCPSMYLHGAKLPELRVTEITKDSKISLNWRMGLPNKVNDFIQKSIQEMSNYQYVPQVLDEIRLMYYGVPFPENKYKNIPSMYPASMKHKFYMEDKAVSFMNVKSWMEYLKTKDLSFGTRIHGNIVSILAGTPCLIVASDARVQELAEYHNIPHILYTNIDKDTDLFDLCKETDFSKIYDGHKERFEHFVGFLNENGLDHIYKEQLVIEEAPFDRKLKEVNLQPPLTPFVTASADVQEKRIAEICDWHRYRMTIQKEAHKQEVAFYKNEIKQLKKKKRSFVERVYHKVFR